MVKIQLEKQPRGASGPAPPNPWMTSSGQTGKAKLNFPEDQMLGGVRDGE